MKKRLLRTLLAALALALAVASCARGDKVIPKKTMEKIYYDMFMADQWLAVHPEARAKADTSWFYEPVFQKYGYTKEDYLRSVDFYLNDPERYAAMLREVTTRLEKDFNRLTAEAEKEREDQHAAAMAAVSSFDQGEQFNPESILLFFEKHFPVEGSFKFVPKDEIFPFYGPARIVLPDTSRVAETPDSSVVEPAAEALPEAVGADGPEASDGTPAGVESSKADHKPEKPKLKEESSKGVEELIFE